MAANRTFDVAKQKGSRQARGWQRARLIQPQAADLIDRLRERVREIPDPPTRSIRKMQVEPGESFALLMAEEKPESDARDKRHREKVTRERRDGCRTHRDKGAASTLLDARITDR